MKRGHTSQTHGGILGLAHVSVYLQSSKCPASSTTELVGTTFSFRWSHQRKVGIMGKDFLEKIVLEMTL